MRSRIEIYRGVTLFNDRFIFYRPFHFHFFLLLDKSFSAKNIYHFILRIINKIFIITTIWKKQQQRMSSSVESLNNKSSKLAWKAEEDAKLTQLVETYGTDGRW